MLSRKELTKSLTRNFNYWIKLKEANSNMMVKCFTCDKVCHISSIDAGHFQSSKKTSTRWDEGNVKPQCRECNGKENGMRNEFAKRLDLEYGKGFANSVIVKSNLTCKYTITELEKMNEYYGSLICTYS